MSNINLLFTYILKCNIEEREERCIKGKSPSLRYSYPLFIDYIKSSPYHKSQIEKGPIYITHTVNWYRGLLAKF